MKRIPDSHLWLMAVAADTRDFMRSRLLPALAALRVEHPELSDLEAATQTHLNRLRLALKGRRVR